MRIKDVVAFLEEKAPVWLQENYDNAGLIVGQTATEVTGILVCLDSTEEVIREAVSLGCNLVVAHHPIVFSGLKRLTGRTYVERTVITAIQHNVAIYAIHTNLDNVAHGVNREICQRLGLLRTRTLRPKEELLCKVHVYVPATHLEEVNTAAFKAGAGRIGLYDECSFQVEGTGTYRPTEASQPYSGAAGIRSIEREYKVEYLVPLHVRHEVLAAIRNAHPYEEMAYDFEPLLNEWQTVGSGMIGELPEPEELLTFLQRVKTTFGSGAIRYTRSQIKQVKTVAVCGGSGSFLIKNAVAEGAHVYITADVKYHEFFDAGESMTLADIGHFESERYTIDLLSDWLAEKFPTFAIRKSGIVTNPINYL
jgi:dinuclear metal center YbgI/SA1388 family protein